MDSVIEFLCSFNWLYLPHLIAESLWHADWKGAYQRSGFAGLCVETLRSAIGINSYPFFVPMKSTWSGKGIQQLLAKHGIRMWGSAFANGTLFFHVKRRQAAWAQYVMLRAGVPLQAPLLGEVPATSDDVTQTTKQTAQHADHITQDSLSDYWKQLTGLLDAIDSECNRL